MYIAQQPIAAFDTVAQRTGVLERLAYLEQT
jgi:hypothetical protein